MGSSIEKVSEFQIIVRGEIRFDNALQLKLLGEKLINEAGNTFDIDCSLVTRAGSAGISVLLSWMRHALALGKELTFSHVPADLMGVASVSGVDGILPIKHD